MTTGVMLFSFNNEHTSYDRLTRRCIKHIKKYLQLPVTVVGDREFERAFNNIKKRQKNLNIWLKDPMLMIYHLMTPQYFWIVIIL